MAYVNVKILDLDTSIVRSRCFEVEEEGALSLALLKSAFPDASGVLYFNEEINDWIW